MPHMFINRKRSHNLAKARFDLRAQFRWETVNALLYLAGGVVFIIGSILFFPQFSAFADIGALVFFLGSLLYLVVTVHDLLEVFHSWRHYTHHDRSRRLEYIAAVSYVLGTVSFTVGSVFFLSAVGWTTAGAWLFIIGSLLFVIGACINVLQIVEADNIQTLQLMNLTAVTFVIGSVLFTVASIPYLWEVKDPALKVSLFDFLAWQYLIGSTLFLGGGVFNYWRAAVVVQDQMKRGNPLLPPEKLKLRSMR